MTYTPNVPQANQTIAQTTDPIRNNFTYIEDALERDHAWQGNIIGTEQPGRHQKVSMPNQPIDIVGALPAGIAATQYCIGANLFTWDGTSKNPLSGKVAVPVMPYSIPAAFTTIATLPNDCIGFICVNFNNTVLYFGNFFSMGGTLYTPTQLIQTINATAQVQIQPSGLALQIRCPTGPIVNSSYKVIYWPI